MKNFTILALLASVVLLFTNCGGANHQSKKETKKVLFVSILPLKYMVEKVAGNQFEVQVLVPPGESPETYSPSTRKIQSMAKAVAYFTIPDLGFEEANMQRVLSNCPDMEKVSVSRGMEMIESGPMQHGDHMHNSGFDPHIWMSPTGARAIVENIHEALIDLDEANKKLYDANKGSFENELKKLDIEVKQILERRRQNSFLVYHPSLTYFARYYEQEQMSIEKEGKEPSAKHLRSLIDLARTRGIETILVQKEFDQSNAKTIANEIGASLVQIDPLAYEWNEQMKKIAKAIVQ